MLSWFAVACAPLAPPPPASFPAATAGLVVLISVDPLPIRLLERARPWLAPDGGFNRLLGPDAFHATAAHTHAVTHTCPGHATLVTGASPSVHGIVGNRWLDAAGKVVYCVDPDGDGTVDLAALRVETLADPVVAAGGRAVSLGLKDRAPLLMGGRDPTAVVYFDRKALAFHGPPWARFAVSLDAAWSLRVAGGYGPEIVDDQPFEGDTFGGRVFPHPPPADAEGWLRSPFAGEALTTVAIQGISAEDLGHHRGVDYLAIGYSQTDYIGHTWGPDSWESVDGLLRLDADLARLFAVLDARLPGAWTVILTSDHGATPASAPRVLAEPLLAAGRAAAHAAGAPDEDLVLDEPNLWLPASTAPDVRPAAARAVAKAVAALPDVAGAWAWKVDPPPPMLVGSLDLERSGDVYVQLAEGHQWSWGETTGADHGSGWPADQQVPLLALGRGVAPGAADDLVDTRAVAATVASLLGISPPAGAELGPLSMMLSNGGRR